MTMEQSKNYQEAIKALEEISTNNCKSEATKFVMAITSAINEAVKNLPHHRKIPELRLFGNVGNIKVALRFRFEENNYIFDHQGLKELIMTYTKRYEVRDLVEKINNQQ